MLKQIAVLCLALTLTSSSFVPSTFAETFRQTLIHAQQGIRLDTWQLTSREFAPQIGVSWSIRKETLHGGKQEGVEIITVDNGKLRFAVVPTRGMSVAEVVMGSIRLGWNSPVKELVHPNLINLESRGGLGWLEGFNEWMVRCGLEFAGHPGKDRFINNVGDPAEMDLTLHGKIGNIPASHVEVWVDKEPPHRIRVRGRVDERMFYGPKLEMWTEISTEPDSNEFTIQDSIKNLGAFDQEFQIIYHANYGPPLLEKGAQFVGAIKQVVPFNDHAAKSVDDFFVYQPPTKGFVEQVYCLYPYADDNQQTLILLRNASENKGVSMRYSIEQLPYLTLWKNTNAEEEGYVTGLEPGTGFPYNRRVERQFGRVPKLKPNQTREFTIKFAIHDSASSIAKAGEEIARIRNSRKMQILANPVRID